MVKLAKYWDGLIVATTTDSSCKCIVCGFKCNTKEWCKHLQSLTRTNGVGKKKTKYHYYFRKDVVTKRDATDALQRKCERAHYWQEQRKLDRAYHSNFDKTNPTTMSDLKRHTDHKYDKRG